MATLEIQNLVVSPGGDFKVGPVSLVVERGEVLCLVGPSGCGKTTLLRAVAGLLEPTEGKILLEGTVLNDPAIRVEPGKRKIGMVFQNLALWPHMRALDQVAFAVPGKGRARKAKAAELLEMVGLSGKARSLPAELSGGEGQRVALARALAREPDLLLLDEPLRSLDPHLRVSLGQVVVDLVKKAGVACLFVTHDREEALRLGDRIAVMNEGLILGAGKAEDLLREPPHPFVEDFLGSGYVPHPPPPPSGGAQAAQPSSPPPPAAEKRKTHPLLRVLFLFGILALAIGAVAAFSTRKPGKRKAPAFTSSAQCRFCHPEVYKEWEESWHSKAWTDPEVRKLSNDFRNQACLSCHVPRPVLETGLDQRVLPRTTRLKEGVGCLTCHMDAQGRIRGSRDVPTAPCSPVKSAALGTNPLCAPCHNQHHTHDQWKASPAAKEGKTCNTCHMLPALRRLPDGTTMKGWSHGFPGSHHPAFIHGAVSLKVKKEKGKIR
ncbi:MAG TPA: ATP-binding cassette domain-containing protein, partial [Planctomycetes bacterium]|nr:ATP-binding cassette domain-containing protein [Planctomycetota bacterium]